MSHSGRCLCGAIELEVTGSPEAMGYCHCSFCRSGSGDPFNAFSLWKRDAFRITAGAQHLATSGKAAMSQSKYCTICGDRLMTDYPALGLVDVFVSTLPTLAFSPSIHINCAEMVLSVRDGLPKLKDFPAALGGSGEMIADSLF
jgi:hypothetical protein